MLVIAGGIVLFLLVEKLVRYVEGISGGANSAWSHGHHHHHRKNGKKMKDDNDACDNQQSESLSEKNQSTLTPESVDCLTGEKQTEHESLLRKRNSISGLREDKSDSDAGNGSTNDIKSLKEKEPAQSPSNLVFGYLNLFSDGVHNFTDGMALGSAFLLYGSVGGWSRTVFLLAHELPQEVPILSLAPFGAWLRWQGVGWGLRRRLRKMSLRLEKIQREFLWGGFSLEKKPYVIKWLIACMERRKGCLGSIRHFLASVVGDMLRSGLLLGIRGKRGGWCSRELKVGDFGILVRSGFSVSKALFFNFLSALVALVGTALALLLGQDPGQSSLIEGFTAGGFIYIAVAGVLPEMNNGNSTLKGTFIQLISLILGMAVALGISLVE
ncbi:IAA-alanine resistance protein 1 [Vitis vinifera]|uniref:IAA-alanine resistance protein 1 n=1 Tax=Vitis vinifera TaxID=29760 RepID=A0A438DGP8_VITVI|nr:IAA-alanine resistance protein 1 [Vitis vinifera]